MKSKMRSIGATAPLTNTLPRAQVYQGIQAMSVLLRMRTTASTTSSSLKTKLSKTFRLVPLYREV